MNIAIIPARGGSKRIPHKNIKEFCGKPLIAYSIEVAQKSKLFDKIIVSTDNEEIAKIAKKYGAEVPFLRPSDLSDDFTGTTPVVSHAIQKLNIKNLEAVCCIYATAPLLKEKYLQDGYKKLINSKLNYVFSATTFAFPIQRAIKLNANAVEMLYPEYASTRSQDLEDAYHDAGQFYWGKPDTWLEQKGVFCENSSIIQLPRHLVQDIDTLEDWERAELMYKVLQNENSL